MLKKVWNTLRSGDARTKKYLYVLFVLLAATVGIIVLAAVQGSLLLGIFAAGAVAADVAVMKSVTLREEGGQAGEQTDREDGKERPQKRTDFGQEEADGQKERAETAAFPEPDIPNYDEEKLKRVMVAYKVKKEHYPVMVDNCKSERAVQCPAYAWTNKGHFYLLLLEKEPRRMDRPLKRLTAMKIERGVPGKPMSDYAYLQERPLLSKVFSPYLPNYYRKDKNGKIESQKNLYVLDSDICFTATSVSNLLKLLQVQFIVEDEKLSSEKYSEYYKAIYKKRILWRDGVLSIEEYKKAMEEVLRRLGRAKLSRAAFEGYVMQMVLDGLIPQEYAELAYIHRKKTTGKEEV